MKVLFPFLAIIVFCLLLINQACKAQPQSPLSGNIELHPDWKPVIYMVQPRHFNEIVADYLGQVVDSAAIDADGSFSFQNLTIPEGKSLVILTVQKEGNRFANHLSDEIPAVANYMPLVLTREGDLAIMAQITNFHKSFTMEGPSKDNQILMALRDARLEAYKSFAATSSTVPENDSLLMEKEDVYNQYTEVMRHFADSTISLEAAMVAIRWVSPNGDFERMPEFLHSQCEKWQMLEPENPYTVELCAVADRNSLPVMTGDVFPDYALPLVTGDTVMLSSLLGQRLTLVDVWASWCAPCRKENREILGPLWAAYKEKGLRIVGYSIDNDKQSWEKAIAKDQAVWIHASHLTGDSTPFMDALRISTIPANFILDSHGKVIAKNLYGEELQNLVREYIK